MCSVVCKLGMLHDAWLSWGVLHGDVLNDLRRNSVAYIILHFSILSGVSFYFLSTMLQYGE